MRDLTLESLPADERELTEIYAARFADSFMHYKPAMEREVALEDARDFISQVWIGMGPQAGPRELAEDTSTRIDRSNADTR